MLLKKKKNIALISLALMLTASSCKSDDNYRERCLENSKNLIEAYDESNNNERLDEFYKEYLNRYVKYMNKEQCNQFIDLMIAGYEVSDNSSYELIYAFLNEIVGVEENKYGRGILRAFNARLVYENLCPLSKLSDHTYDEINTLRLIVDDDDAFFSSLFSGNMDNLVECIKSHTGFQSSAEIEELILQFDYYSDIRESEEYNDKELEANYEIRIAQIMRELVKSKLATNETFANTLYGKIVSNSRYMGSYKYNVYNNLFDDKASIWRYKDGSSYSFSIPSYYLHTDKEISEIKAEKVCDIIEHGDDANNHNVVTLLIHLIDPYTFSYVPDMYKPFKGDQREIFYDNLSDEFETIEDFDDFFLFLASGDSMTYDDYFIILEHRIKKDGITYDDFVRFTSLANFINAYENVFFDWYLNDHPPYEEIKKMKKEEYKDFVYDYTYNSMFGGMSDYQVWMEMVYSLIKDNDLGFEQLYAPNCQYVYDAGRILILESSPSVISKEIFPTIGSINGTKVVYYEIPDNYETGTAVESFINIERKLTVVQVSGLKRTFFDEISGKTVNGFIVDFGDEIDETMTPIRFMEYHKYYEENQENKKLILGDE